MLTPESQATLDQRVDRGTEIAEHSWGGEVTCEDFDTACRDAISNVLTARFGPAGHIAVNGKGDHWIETNSEVYADASALVYSALQAYFSDAEDYVEVRQPEPGQYGYEEPEAPAEIVLRLGDNGWAVV